MNKKDIWSRVCRYKPMDRDRILHCLHMVLVIMTLYWNHNLQMLDYDEWLDFKSGSDILSLNGLSDSTWLTHHQI